LVSFVEANLHQIGRAALPFVTAAHAEPERLEEFDNLCEAFTTNHVANRASRAQGKAFLSAVQRIFGERGLQAASTPGGAATLKRTEVRAPSSHLAPVFGASLSRLDVPIETTSRLFFFNHLRSILAAAVRLNIVGPMEAQGLQHRLTSTAESALETCGSLMLEDIAQTSLLELWQGAQDRLYSRLFQS
jgi:urease accessory protein